MNTTVQAVSRILDGAGLTGYVLQQDDGFKGTGRLAPLERVEIWTRGGNLDSAREVLEARGYEVRARYDDPDCLQCLVVRKT